MILGLYLVLGIFLYYITVHERDNRAIINKQKCIKCGRWVEEKSLYCPYCNETLKKKCDKCGQLIEVNWRSCPFCREVDSTL